MFALLMCTLHTPSNVLLATLNKTLASANMLAFIIYLKPLSLLYSSSPFIYLRSLVSNHWSGPFA